MCSGGADTVTGGGGQTPEAGSLACVLLWAPFVPTPPSRFVGRGPSAPRPRFPPARASPPALGLLPCRACPSLSPSALPCTGTMHESFRAGFRLGLRLPVIRPSRMLHDTLPFLPAGTAVASLPSPQPALSPVTVLLPPSSSSRLPLRRPSGVVFVLFLGGGRPGGGGRGGGGFPVVPSPGVCTLRAQRKHVAWHMSVGGGSAPFRWPFPTRPPRLLRFPRGPGRPARGPSPLPPDCLCSVGGGGGGGVALWFPPAHPRSSCPCRWRQA